MATVSDLTRPSQWVMLNKNKKAETWVNPYKIVPPELGRATVKRRGLLAATQDAHRYQVILLTGPAGFGKTTFSAQWLKQIPARMAWYGLDSSDNLPSYFAAHLITSIHQATDFGCPEAYRIASQGQFSSLALLLNQLSVELAQIQQHIYVVLDDFHEIHEPTIQNAVREWLRYLPPNIHLVICSHQEPNIGISNLRVKGRILEIEADALAFSELEAEEFLQLHNQAEQFNSPEEKQRLYRQLSGWPAGYQLLAFGQTEDIQRFTQTEPLVPQLTNGLSNTDRTRISEYVIEEVLLKQPEHIQQCLLDLSLVERFSLTMAQKLTGRNDCQLILDSLLNQRLFITRLPGPEDWFQFQDLFRKCMAHYLISMQPDQVHRLQHKTFECHLAEEQYFEALDISRKLNDLELLRRVLEEAGMYFYQSGQLLLLDECLSQLPRQVLIEAPQLLLLRVWTNLATYKEADISALLDSAEANQNPHPFAAEFAVARAQAAINREQYDQARELAESATSSLSDDSVVSKTFALSVLGQCELCVGELDKAVTLLHQAQVLAGQCNLTEPGLWSRCLQSDAWIAKGELNRASAIQKQAIHFAHDQGTDQTLHMEFLFRNRAWYLLERLRVDEALVFADKATDIIRPLGEYGLLPVFTIRALAAIIQGQPDVSLMEQIKTLLDKFDYHTDWTAHAQDVLLWYVQQSGDLDYLPGFDPKKLSQTALNHFNLHYQVNYAWMLSLSGKVEEAITLLKTLLPLTENLGMNFWLTKIVSRLFALTGDQKFLDQLDPQVESIHPWLSLTMLDSETIRERYLAGLSVNKSGPIEKGDPLLDKLNSQLTGEKLTDKEWQVFKYIGSEITNDEIAQLMHVAPSTVKSHIRRLYRKLGIERRQQTLDIYRHLFNTLQ